MTTDQQITDARHALDQAHAQLRAVLGLLANARRNLGDPATANGAGTDLVQHNLIQYGPPDPQPAGIGEYGAREHHPLQGR